MVGLNPVRGILSTPASSATGGGGFQPYAAGKKVYGQGRTMPNVGLTSNTTGYAKRDGAMAARRDAFMDRAGKL